MSHKMSMKNGELIASNHYLGILASCNGIYVCPKSGSGLRLGPLAGYAGTYEGPGGKKMHFVGDIYVNFAKAESRSGVLGILADDLAMKIQKTLGVNAMDCLCGAPIGGYSLAVALGLAIGSEVILAEKKVTAVATPDSREESELVFARHEIEKGRRYVIVEDVCNNFSTTEKFISLITSAGGEVAAIVCFLNRSLSIIDSYQSACYPVPLGIPVISLVDMPIEEFKQSDPEVAADVDRGLVVWKPKNEWPRLMNSMKACAC